MNKVIPVLILVMSFLGNKSYCQVVTDGFNNTSSIFTLSGGNFYSSNSGSGDRPDNTSFSFEGSASYGVTGTATLTSSDINTTANTVNILSFKLASFSINSGGNGADGDDEVLVEISPDGGNNYYRTLTVSGYNDAWWGFTSGTGIATTPYDGNTTPVDFAPTGGGERTTDGYNTINITNLPQITNLRVRITLLNNHTDELWLIDDFKIADCIPTQTITSFLPISGSSGTLVTITGTNFSGATAVKFGGVDAVSFNVINATTIIAEVPANAASGAISVTVSNCETGFGNFIVLTETGCGGSGSSITINTQPADDNGCTGSVIFSVDASTTPSGSPTYVWHFNDPATMSSWGLVSDMDDAPYNLSVGGINTNSITLTGATAVLQNFQFYVEVQFGSPQCVVASDAAQYVYNTRSFYQSTNSGNWSTPGIWEMSDDNSNWVSACSYPSANNSQTINIRDGHNILLNIDNRVNQLTVENDGTLRNDPNSQLTVTDATTAADFNVNGTYEDNSTSTNTFTLEPGATWQLGNYGTIIKTNSGGSVYRDSYQGGISNIPAGANWIYRYTGSSINFLGSTGSKPMYYPNLTLENTQAGTYSSSINNGTPQFSEFTLYGPSMPITIIGNFDVGGSGTGNIDFSNISSYAPLKIERDLIVRLGSTLKLDSAIAPNTGKGFDVAGNVIIDGTFKATVGTVPTGDLIFSGTGTQTISGSGTLNLEDVNINNSGSGNVIVDKNFGIPGTLSFGNPAAYLTFGSGTIHLKSTYDRTANVGVIPSGAVIAYPDAGRFIVERYINIESGEATEHPKSWQFLSTPVRPEPAVTVRANWQEGGSNIPGFGTLITDPAGTASGFDGLSGTPSLKYFDINSNIWVSKGSTLIPIFDKRGYMIFIRGDRSVSFPNTAINATTMRIKGKIFDAVTLPPSTTINSTNSFESIGNPYASAIDFKLVKASLANIENSFTAWDPSLSGNYGFGGYITFAGSTGFTPTPGTSDNYPGASTDYSHIQSGQAFFVKSTAPIAIINFAESMKAGGSRMVFREQGKNEIVMLSTLLFTDKGNIADGNRVVFDEKYSDKIDKDDASKLKNGGENFGLTRDGASLAVEARGNLDIKDTLHYNMSNLRPGDYQLRFAVQNFKEKKLVSELIDQYLKTRTNVSLTDSTFINLKITNDPGSKANDRFLLVFRNKTPHEIPAFITNADAYLQNTEIAINWQSENEIDGIKYIIEQSEDSLNFKILTQQDAQNNTTASYSVLDKNPSVGYNYYRVKSILQNEILHYSNIVKVLIENNQLPIVIYPNPVKDGNINLQFSYQPKGDYKVRLLNSVGQQITSGKITHSGGKHTETIRIPKNKSLGLYYLEISQPNGMKVLKKIFN